MYKDKRIAAIILARGGSKGLPDKNIMTFQDRPLIYWSIDAAKKSKYVDNVFVSTDSDKVADIAAEYDAEVPFMRPKELSTDDASSMDALLHGAHFLKDKGHIFDIVVSLQPTSPLRKHEDIDNAVELLFEKEAKAVISVNEAIISPLWMNVLPADGCMKDFIGKDVINSQRQDNQTYFQLNGSIFLGFVDYLVENNSFYGNESFAYVMPKERSIDIDDIYDFQIAEFLIARQNKTKRR